MKNLDVLYDLCEALSEELEEANEKLRMAGGKMSAGDLEVIDKLSHALKSIKTTIVMEEADGEYSYANENRVMPRYGMSYARGDGRGRGRSARRDSMGRYSRAGGVKEMLEQAMSEAETDREREAIRKAMKEL